MISLALRRKVALGEDVLTAALLDCFRARPERGDLRMLMGRARALPDCVLPAFDRTRIELWPSHRAGEPDARIVLLANMQVVAHLLVEAKLWAAKSGAGEITDDRRAGDQLARYLLAEQEDHPGLPVFLLYLTHHVAYPREDLHESQRWLEKSHRPDLISRFFWLSWRDVDTILAAMPDRTDLADVRELLRRAGMCRFQAFHTEALGQLASHGFYSARVPRQPQFSTAPYPGTNHPPRFATEGAWPYSGVRQGLRWPTVPPRVSSATFYRGSCI